MHDGITASYVPRRKDEECPVCLKDKKIEELQIRGEYLVLYFIMRIDTLRVMSLYEGNDREQIKEAIGKVNSELNSSNREGNHSLRILEKYFETRKTFPWKDWFDLNFGD